MTRFRLMQSTGLIVLALALHGMFMTAMAIEPAPKATPGTADEAQTKLPRRVPWNTSKIAGSPDPPSPYTVELAFPHLKFESPVVLVSAKGTERLFLGEVNGRVYSFPNDPRCTRPDLALDLAKLHPDLTMFYGLVFHPDFDKNHYVYVCYVRKNDLPDGSAVSRFTVSRTDPPVIDPASEQVILNFYSGGHNGGCLEFGNDGYLYISTGDAASPSPPDSMMTGQDCSDLLSSILRIDVNHSEPGKVYRIPADNPFLNRARVRPEIWSFGFRNPWKMTFDRKTGDLWVGDVGWELWEMVYKVKRGGNYGWSIMEGPQPVNVEAKRGPTKAISPPIKSHPHSEAASITGGYVYHGKRLPRLVGAYLYGDFLTGIIWGLRTDGERVVWEQELARTPLHLVAFGEDHDGELYLLDYDRTKQIYRLVPNPGAAAHSDFPRRLSQTGLFASTRDHRPAPGVVPYTINAALWSDGAAAERFLAIPGSAAIEVDQQGNPHFPDQSVLVRTVSIEREPKKPATRRRVETQILHLDAQTWKPYSYLWNDDQTDATLVEPGGTTIPTLAVHSPGGPAAPRDYRVYARSECLVCHNPWVEKKGLAFGIQSASPLAVSMAQLNNDAGSRETPASNQLSRWQQTGLLSGVPDVARLPRLVDPYDESLDLDRRARSYLQVNCAHCHQSGAGGTATIELLYELPLAQTKTVNCRPIQGNFDIPAHRSLPPESHRPRFCIIGWPSWAAAGCRASDRMTLTRGRSD